MSDSDHSEPTPEEIERVKAWETERRRQAAAKYQAEHAAKREKASAAIRAMFEGKTVESVTVSTDYADEVAGELRIVFTDGSQVELEAARWTDERHIEIAYVEPEKST